MLPTTTAPGRLSPPEASRFQRFEQHLRARWSSAHIFETVAHALPLLVPDAEGAVYTWDGPLRVGCRAGTNPDFARRLDGLPLARLRRYDPGRPDPSANRAVRLEDLYRGDEVGRVRYVEEVGSRLGADRTLRVLLYDGTDFVAWAGLLRRADQPAFELRDVALVQRAVPLLHDVLTGARALASQRAAGHGFTELVDAMDDAVLIVSGHGVVLYMNTIASKRFDGAPSWIDRCGGRNGRDNLPPGVRQVPVDVNGQRVFLVFADAPRVETTPEATEVQWQRRLGLSPSLARVASLMVEGHTDREIGERLGLKFNSVRTYARRIYAQTGARNRVELARLAARSGAVDWRV